MWDYGIDNLSKLPEVTCSWSVLELGHGASRGSAVCAVSPDPTQPSLPRDDGRRGDTGQQRCEKKEGEARLKNIENGTLQEGM